MRGGATYFVSQCTSELCVERLAEPLRSGQDKPVRPRHRDDQSHSTGREDGRFRRVAPSTPSDLRARVRRRANSADSVLFVVQPTPWGADVEDDAPTCRAKRTHAAARGRITRDSAVELEEADIVVVDSLPPAARRSSNPPPLPRKAKGHAPSTTPAASARTAGRPSAPRAPSTSAADPSAAVPNDAPSRESFFPRPIAVLVDGPGAPAIVQGPLLAPVSPTAFAPVVAMPHAAFAPAVGSPGSPVLSATVSPGAAQAAAIEAVAALGAMRAADAPAHAGSRDKPKPKKPDKLPERTQARAALGSRALGAWKTVALASAFVATAAVSAIVARALPDTGDLRDSWTSLFTRDVPVEPLGKTRVAPLLAPVVERAGAIGSGTSPCEILPGSRVLTKRALVGAGLESISLGPRVAFGVATSARDGLAVELVPSTLASAMTTKVIAAEPIRRVVPILTPDETLDAIADVDGESDLVRNATTVVDPERGTTFVLGAVDAHLAWAHRPSDIATKIWPLGSGGPVEGLRAVSLGHGQGFAIAFRRDGAIWLGAIRGDDAHAPKGPLVSATAFGHQIGTPSLAVSGDDVMVTWAERDEASQPWAIRYLRWRRGESVGTPKTFTLPEGGLGVQGLAPSVASLGDGRFFLAWTEGPASNHQVRAQVMRPDGALFGAPITISPARVHAGQAKVAIGPTGRGVVAYLASHANGFDLVATRLTCHPRR